MTPTPMLDAAIMAGCKKVYADQTCIYPDCESCYDTTLETLRQAFPWTPAPEVVEAMRETYATHGQRGNLRTSPPPDDVLIAMYRAQPIVQELWPEEER